MNPLYVNISINIPEYLLNCRPRPFYMPNYISPKKNNNNNKLINGSQVTEHILYSEFPFF